MAENVKATFGGFDALVGNFLSSDSEEKRIGQDNEPTVDPEDIKREMESLDNPSDKDENNKDQKSTPAEDKKKSTSKKVENEQEEEEEEEVEDESDEDTEPQSTTNPDGDEEEIEEVELVSAFTDLFAAELGWEIGDDEKPKTAKELVKYMQNIIESNSEPKYASDEIKELDEYVKNGGKLQEFYSKVYNPELDLSTINLEKESHQKLVIKSNLKHKGYSDTRIEKLIARYEETGSLEDEAKDSYEEEKEFEQKTKKELLEQTKKQAEESMKEQLKFVQNVEEIIKSSDSIRGIDISEKDKKSLMEYIFKPEADGTTKYQKEYSSNLKNLVESAYFTMKKDTLVKQIEKKASTDAIKNLKLKLKTKGKATKNSVSEENYDTKVAKLWEMASEKLTTFN
jgi:hypothetical protein